jgi:VWFA-related protein
VPYRAFGSACLRALALMFVAVPAAAQGLTQKSDPPPRFTTEASAVVLDVVVRDDRRRPVTGLRREDFQVFEDRSRQTITVFEAPAARPTVPDGPSAPTAAASAASVVSPSPPRVVALVFEQLGPGARVIAAKAAHRLVESLGPGDFAGVFLVDRAV